MRILIRSIMFDDILLVLFIPEICLCFSILYKHRQLFQMDMLWIMTNIVYIIFIYECLIYNPGDISNNFIYFSTMDNDWYLSILLGLIGFLLLVVSQSFDMPNDNMASFQIHFLFWQTFPYDHNGIGQKYHLHIFSYFLMSYIDYTYFIEIKIFTYLFFHVKINFVIFKYIEICYHKL